MDGLIVHRGKKKLHVWGGHCIMLESGEFAVREVGT